MVKGEANTTKVHFKGKEDDFIVFVENAKVLTEWKSDKTIPLAQVVGAFSVFTTGKHGAQGTLDSASHQTLDNEFGTHVDEDVIKQILEKGTIQEGKFSERSSTTNDSMGARAGH